jgi:hypothetical protein
MVQVCEGAKTKGGMLEEAIVQYKDIFMRAKNGFNHVVTVSLARPGWNAAHQNIFRAFKTGWNPLQVITIGVVARVGVAAVELEPGEVGEVVDQMVDQGREEEAGGTGTTMRTTTPMVVPVVVQDVGVVVGVELEGDEVQHHHRRHRHHPDHLLLQMT